VCQWTAIVGDDDGVFGINNLDGKMLFDRLTFLVYKDGGFTITQPVITWFGAVGKPALPILVPERRATGAELMTTTTTHSLTGWTVVGSLTPSSDATYMLPYGLTGFVVVDATNKLRQTLNYVVNNTDDVEIEIRVTCRRFPAVFDHEDTYPDNAPITQDTFDWTRIVVELIEPADTFNFTQTKKVGLWWDEVVFRSILPMRVNPLDIVIGADAEVQVAKVSVRVV
jgi:hypothetical protein